MRQIIGLLILCLMIGSFSACVSKKKFTELEMSKAASDSSLAQTQQQVQTLQGENQTLQASLESEKTRMTNEMANLRRDMDANKGQVSQLQEKLNMTQAELDKITAEINGMFAGYETSGLTMEERDGRLYIMTATPVNYASGSTKLSRAERKALGDLATTLKNNADLRILVEGHTDSQKYPRGAGYDNWNLSVDRAMSVVRELMRRGVSSKQVAVVGRGDAMPAGDNTSASGRSQNRRTVIAPDVNVGAAIRGGMMNRDSTDQN